MQPETGFDIDALDAVESTAPLVTQFVLDLSSAPDRRIVADALRLLLRERSDALNFAMRIAAEHGQPRPDPGGFGLSDILRLLRTVERVDVPD
ncbi:MULTISPECIES: hypothetical protein [Burkholderia]|uniref:Uncharacterized protein n=1 Tax=Burkholderia singularis TaxID=1503053 RepID=A0A238H773_9BURK|nr:MULTISPECIES: hypothetical protein [Burkholderia]SMG01179.1 hypothetical protein BSIN_4212 [Burkholderia singularis]